MVGEVPCGPVMGCHMAPCGWLVGCVKVYGLHRDRTPDLFSGKHTGRTGLTSWATLVLIMYMIKNIFEFKLRFCWWGKGSGLSPSPRFNLYDHTTI